MATGSKTVIYAALVGNFAIAVTKFGAALFTRSSAMFAEGIHSLVDTGNQGLLLLGLKRSKRPPDADFPLGHGKEIYFWSFVVAMSIFAVGAGVSLFEGVKHVLHPREITNPGVNYVVLAAAMLFEGAAWFLAWRGFRAAKGKMGYLAAVRHSKDPTLFVVLFEDTAAMLGLVVAFAGIALAQFTGFGEFDGIASILIGLILGATAFWLARETKGLLIGESATVEVRHRLLGIIRSHAAVTGVSELITLHMGPEAILVAASLDIDDKLPVAEVEAAVSSLNRTIKEAEPQVMRVFIEVESPGLHRAQVAEVRRRT